MGFAGHVPWLGQTTLAQVRWKCLLPNRRRAARPRRNACFKFCRAVDSVSARPLLEACGVYPSMAWVAAASRGWRRRPFLAEGVRGAVVQVARFAQSAKIVAAAVIEASKTGTLRSDTGPV